MFCSRCGQEIGQAAYCPSCGEPRLTGSPAPSTELARHRPRGLLPPGPRWTPGTVPTARASGSDSRVLQASSSPSSSSS